MASLIHRAYSGFFPFYCKRYVDIASGVGNSKYGAILDIPIRTLTKCYWLTQKLDIVADFSYNIAYENGATDVGRAVCSSQLSTTSGSLFLELLPNPAQRAGKSSTGRVNIPLNSNAVLQCSGIATDSAGDTRTYPPEGGYPPPGPNQDPESNYGLGMGWFSGQGLSIISPDYGPVFYDPIANKYYTILIVSFTIGCALELPVFFTNIYDASSAYAAAYTPSTSSLISLKVNGTVIAPTIPLYFDNTGNRPYFPGSPFVTQADLSGSISIDFNNFFSFA